MNEILEQRTIIDFIVVLHATLAEKHGEEVCCRSNGHVVPRGNYHFGVHALSNEHEQFHEKFIHNCVLSYRVDCCRLFRIFLALISCWQRGSQLFRQTEDALNQLQNQRCQHLNVQVGAQAKRPQSSFRIRQTSNRCENIVEQESSVFFVAAEDRGHQPVSVTNSETVPSNTMAKIDYRSAES